MTAPLPTATEALRDAPTILFVRAAQPIQAPIPEAESRIMALDVEAARLPNESPAERRGAVVEAARRRARRDIEEAVDDGERIRALYLRSQDRSSTTGPDGVEGALYARTYRYALQQSTGRLLRAHARLEAQGRVEGPILPPAQAGRRLALAAPLMTLLLATLRTPESAEARTALATSSGLPLPPASVGANGWAETARQIGLSDALTGIERARSAGDGPALDAYRAMAAGSPPFTLGGLPASLASVGDAYTEGFRTAILRALPALQAPALVVDEGSDIERRRERAAIGDRELAGGPTVFDTVLPKVNIHADYVRTTRQPTRSVSSADETVTPGTLEERLSALLDESSAVTEEQVPVRSEPQPTVTPTTRPVATPRPRTRA